MGYREALIPVSWVSFAALVISFIIVMIDRGPPLPPFKNGFESFDCHGLQLLNSTVSNGQIRLNFKKLESIEYPPEYLPNFVKLNVKTDHANLEYSGGNLIEFEHSSKYMNMTFAAPFPGHGKFSLTCLNNLLSEFESEIPDFQPVNSPYSYGSKPGLSYSRLNDVCLENNKILFFTKEKGSHANVNVGNQSVVVELLDLKKEKYLQQKKVSFMHRISALIPNLPNDPLHLILFALPSLSQDIEKLVTMSEPDSWTKQLSRMLSLPDPTNRSDIMCFCNLVIPEIRFQLENEDAVKHAIGRDFSAFRSHFLITSQIRKGKIVVPEKLKQKVARVCINCTVEALDKNLFELRKRVADAHVLIANDLASLVTLTLMNPGSSVIDISESQFTCRWRRELAERNNVSYYSLHDEMCTCQSKDCYTYESNKLEATELEKLQKLIENLVM